ncbi:MAG TPA: acyloxyacyl hydrolase [Alphaproteobacteria bacterium]|nr:acyloxyacyl hydrolase [Alphaproteobacteria bacterium]
MRVALGLLSLLTLSVLVVPAHACSETSWYSCDSSDFIEFQLGSFDVRRDHSFAYNFEYRSDYEIFGYIKPIVGILSTSRKAVYGYGGFAVDFYLGSNVYATPSLAIGGYERADDARLGAAFPEFRSAIGIAYRFDDDSRLGVAFYHISNAGLSRSNPGSEVAVLTYAYPLQNLRELIGE